MTRIAIAQLIRAYRGQHRLTQEAFGRRLGVSPQAISKWEREECYPDITLLPDLARLLGCQLTEFFREEA